MGAQFTPRHGFGGENFALWTDSSAAKALCDKNVTKVKHMELKHLFLKDYAKKALVEIKKVRGDKTPADVLTKPVARETLLRLRAHFVS